MLEEGSRIPVEACNLRVNHGSKCHSRPSNIGAAYQASSMLLSRSFSTVHTLIHKPVSNHRIMKALLRPKHWCSRRRAPTVTLPKHVPISTGTIIVAAAKVKLRAAVISDEMRKSIFVEPYFPSLPACTLSSSIWRSWRSATTARKEFRIPWCEGKLKPMIYE